MSMNSSVRSGRILWLSPTLLLPAISAAALLASCSQSSVGASSVPGGAGSANFTLVSVSVSDQQVWQINRAISFTFSQAVDFGTVNLNTINLQELNGAPAVGDFFVDSLDPRTVVFQPVCPKSSSLSDAGFVPGGTRYRIHVPDEDTGPTTVRSMEQDTLKIGRTLTFETPTSTQLDDLFLDPVAGPPSPLLLPFSSTASYVELGGDPQNRRFFEVGSTGTGHLPAGFRVPINLYSDQTTQVVVVIEFNQPVSPSAENISTNRMFLQYKLESGLWTGVATEIELAANCTETGSQVRLIPVGVLPQGRELRVVISPEFEDLVGDRNIVQLDDFARMDSDFAQDGVGAPVETADEFLEGYLTGDFEDRLSAFDSPRADWGPTGLSASFAFDGTGGLGGEFDFHIPDNTDFVFDTNTTVLLGGPGGVHTGQQTAINGRMNVRDFFLPASSSMRIQGPNRALILASGTVIIEGHLSVNGSNAAQVSTLNTPHQPEPGAAGQGGGGSGGTASFLTTQVTPRGENGFGAFNAPNGGGEGGEGGWSPTSTSTNRRAGGGGGGVFGADVPASTVPDCPDQSIYGLDAEAGFVGGPNAFSTQDTSRQPPWGGHEGPSPFSDFGGTDDDFWGTKRKEFDTSSETLVTGELLAAHAGAGGGGGGDATRIPGGSYPPPNLVFGDSDKGCGGGGGAGSLTILALGDIVVTSTGEITAIGGHGSGGENTGGINRIGGGSGGGSGGHLVLQTAGKIDLSDIPTTIKGIDARGGEGGAGTGNTGGANTSELNNIRADAKHSGFPSGPVGTTGDDNPWIPTIAQECFDYNATTPTTAGTTKYVVRGTGGDGGPGVIQMHVGNLSSQAPLTPDILYPGAGFESTLASIVRPYPHGYDGTNKRWEDQLLPVFGRISKAQTKWIPLGGVTVAPGTAVSDPLSFLFQGTDAMTGLVLSSGGAVVPQAAILAPASAVEDPGLPEITGSHTLRFDASELADDLYKTNAKLLRRFDLKVGLRSFTVASAEYSTDGAGEYIDVTIESSGVAFGSEFGQVELIPRYFRVTTAGTVDAMPDSVSIKIEFQATVKNTLGNPSLADNPSTPEDETPSPWNTDITALDTVSGQAKTWSFLRYRVAFDIGVNGDPLSAATPRPSLEFLRMPFRF